MTRLAILFVFALILSGVVIRIAISAAQRFGVADRPGGHKLHEQVTPFVGGAGVLAALLSTLAMGGEPREVNGWQVMAASAVVMFLVGLTDDIKPLSFKLRFAVQACVASLMALGAGVALSDLGSLFSGELVELGYLAVPLTVFATVGVINALNMIDGIDGLSGALSLASLFLIALVAHAGGQSDYVMLAVGLMGGLIGFLYFNLRNARHRRARVFLGDNGSMMLGFLFAWLLIALSQGEQRAMPPVIALWLFAIPLMDTVGVMLRRLWLGKSPFHPDRHHLHHLFIRAGFRIQDIVYIIALLHLGIGLLGIAGMLMYIPEVWMLLAFLLLFVFYFYSILRPWRIVPALRRLHTLFDLASPDTRGVFIGNCSLEGTDLLLRALAEEMSGRDDYRLAVYQTERVGRAGQYVYAVLEIMGEDNAAAADEVRRLVETLKRRLKGRMGMRVRQFLVRNPANERRLALWPTNADLRQRDRRSMHGKTLIHSCGLWARMPPCQPDH